MSHIKGRGSEGLRLLASKGGNIEPRGGSKG